MRAKALEDMPGIGIKKGDTLTVVATHKREHRVTVKREDGKRETVDSFRVEILGPGESE